MKLFIDTANIDEIKEINEMGVICGVTTNPSLIAKEGGIFEKRIEEISKIIDGPISAEVVSLEKNKMIEEAVALSKINKNIVIKLPLTIDGLKSCKELTKMGIKTNMTLIFTPSQALLAARAGATYVSPFLGRLEDIGVDGYTIIEEIVEIFRKHNIKTEIIAASIRNPLHVKNVAKIGADIATVPYKVIMDMVKHELTDKGIEKFIKDWEKNMR